MELGDQLGKVSKGLSDEEIKKIGVKKYYKTNKESEKYVFFISKKI